MTTTMDKKKLNSAIRTVVMIAILLILLFLAFGCKTIKKSINEKTDTKDSVRIEYREKVVKVPVTVYVEVPVENVSTTTKDSTSHLETSFAISNASMVWIDGVPFLRHDLKNKAQKIEKTEDVPVVEKEKVVYQTRRVTYTKTEIREKSLTWWQDMKIKFGEVSFGLNILFILVVLLYKKFLRRKD